MIEILESRALYLRFFKRKNVAGCLWIIFLLFLHIDLSATVHMGIISNAGYFGEREIGWRIKRAAESLGWTVFLDETKGRKIQRARHLDWVICLIPDGCVKQDCLNYLTLFHFFNFFDQGKKICPFYEKYDGYLLTIQPEHLHNAFKSEDKKISFIPFYPTVQKTEYKRLQLNALVTSIPVWGNRINEEKFKTFYSLLSRSGLVKFYGPQKKQGIVQSGYMGQIPFDGISVLDTLQKHGIVLVIHSSHHNDNKIPSGRIFEAAAASTVIISDENSFVKEHFVDSVYYIDTSLSAEEIYNQIIDHMNHIADDPETALAKAKKAHQIFTDKFLMTDQLLQLEAMHNRIKNSHDVQ